MAGCGLAGPTTVPTATQAPVDLQPTVRAAIQATLAAGAVVATATPVPATATPAPAPATATVARALPTPDAAERVRTAFASIVRVTTPKMIGTGFAVARPDGSTGIITNAHVVEGATAIRVIAPNGETWPASLVNRDPLVDLVLLEAIGLKAPPLPLATSSPEIGEPVLVIGHAVGTQLQGDPTVTRGIVSSRRQVEGVEYLQTDAAMNPGNSGGPVLTAAGTVAGVATWGIRTNQRVAIEGIGFAIPTVRVQALLARPASANVAAGGAPPIATLPPTTALPAARAANLRDAAFRSIYSLPGTSSGVFLNVGNPEASAVDDPDMVMPAASLIKLMIAGTVYQQVALGRWPASQALTLTEDVKVGGTGILRQQPAGSRYTLEQLVDIMLQYSDNTAANMLIDAVGGFGPVNSFSAGLGLEQTQLRRKLADTQAQARGIENTTSAADVTAYLLRLATGQIVNWATSERILGSLMKRAERDRDWMLLGLPNGVAAAHMTGILPGMRADAGIIVTGNAVYVLTLFVRDPDEAGMERGIARVSQEIYTLATRP